MDLSKKKRQRVYYRELRDRRRHDVREWLDFLVDHSHCSRCGFDDSRALTFHHREPGEKDRGVADMRSGSYSLKAVKREVQKCDIVCANCHAIINKPS